MTQLLRLSHPPHSGRPPKYPVGQEQVVRACLEHDTVVCALGRGWGKTGGWPYVALAEGAMIPEFYELGYFAPFTKHIHDPFRRWKRLFGSLLTDQFGLHRGYNETELTLHLRPWGRNKGAAVRCWGLEEYDNVRGPRLHRAIVDEVKDVPPLAITEVVVPMTIGRRGGGLLLQGTPKLTGVGSAFFRDKFREGLRGGASIKSLTAPSFANPFVTAKEIATTIGMSIGFHNLPKGAEDERLGDAERLEIIEAWASTPAVQEAFPGIREEIFAQFLDSAGQVFPNLQATFSVEVLRLVPPYLWIGEEPDRGDDTRAPDEYVIGFDVGFENAASAAAVFNRRTRRQAALLRMPRVDQADQRRRLETLRRHYNNATVYFDATGGYGLAVCGDAARFENSGYIGKVWGQAAKEQDIAYARFLCERAGRPATDGRDWGLLRVQIQRNEFEDYAATTKTSDGRPLRTVQYGAPPGRTADTVAACCLVAEFLQRAYVPGVPLPKPVARGSVGWWDEQSRLQHGEHTRLHGFKPIAVDEDEDY